MEKCHTGMVDWRGIWMMGGWEDGTVNGMVQERDENMVEWWDNEMVRIWHYGIVGSWYFGIVAI